MSNILSLDIKWGKPITEDTLLKNKDIYSLTRTVASPYFILVETEKYSALYKLSQNGKGNITYTPLLNPKGKESFEDTSDFGPDFIMVKSSGLYNFFDPQKQTYLSPVWFEDFANIGIEGDIAEILLFGDWYRLAYKDKKQTKTKIYTIK